MILSRLFVILVWFRCLANTASHAQPLRGKHTRRLETSLFTVEITVTLFYVDELLERQFLKAIRDPRSVDTCVGAQHFCKSVHEQITSSAVTSVAASMGVSLKTERSASVSSETECSFTNAKRTMKSITEELPSRYILNVTVEHIVNVTHLGSISPEDVSGWVNHGFMTSTGGLAKLRTSLIQESAFHSVSEVKVFVSSRPLSSSSMSIPSLSALSPSMMSSAPSLSIRTTKPSTSQILTLHSPNAPIPTSAIRPTPTPSNFIESRDGRNGESRDKKAIMIGSMVGALVFVLLVACFVHFRNFSSHMGRMENTDQENEIDLTCAVIEGATVLRITKVVHEDMTGYEWDPNVRVPSTSGDSTPLPSAITNVTKKFSRGPLDMSDQKDDEQEDLFTGLCQLYPYLKRKKVRSRLSKSRKRITKSFPTLKHDHMSGANAILGPIDVENSIGSVKLPSGETDAGGAIDLVCEVNIPKHVDSSSDEVRSASFHGSTSISLVSRSQVTDSLNHEATPIDICRTSTTADEDEEVLDSEPSESTVSSDGSESDDIKKLLMREFPRSSESPSFDLRDDSELQESREEIDDVSSSRTRSNGWNGNDVSEVRKTSDYDGPLWSILWEARQLYEATQASLELLTTVSVDELQSGLEMETSQNESNSTSHRVLLVASVDEDILSSGSNRSSFPAIPVSIAEHQTICEEKNTDILQLDIPQLETNDTRLLEEIQSNDSLIFEDSYHPNGSQGYRDKTSWIMMIDRFNARNHEKIDSCEKHPDRVTGKRSPSQNHEVTTRSLDEDLKRLDMQLSDVLRHHIDTSSSITSKSTHSSQRNKRRRIVVTVPPGKLGIVLANRYNGAGIFVSEVRPLSCLYGIVTSGDKLVALDGENVTAMTVSEVTKLIKSRSDYQRTFTVLKKSNGIQEESVV